MIAEQYERAKQILSEKAEGHEQLSQILLEKEIIYAEDLELVFGKRQWVSRAQEILESNEESNDQPKEASKPEVPFKTEELYQ